MLDLSRYTQSSALVLTLVAVGILGSGAVLWWAPQRFSRRAAWCLSLGWAWAFTLAILTLVPVDLGGTSVNLVPFDRLLGDPFSILNLALNVLLFVPAGALVTIALVRHPALWLSMIVTAAAGIEFVQHYANLQRSADVNDVIAASLGVLLGVALVRLLAPHESWPRARG